MGDTRPLPAKRGRIVSRYEYRGRPSRSNEESFVGRAQPARGQTEHACVYPLEKNVQAAYNSLLSKYAPSCSPRATSSDPGSQFDEVLFCIERALASPPPSPVVYPLLPPWLQARDMHGYERWQDDDSVTSHLAPVSPTTFVEDGCEATPQPPATTPTGCTGPTDARPLAE